MVAVDAMPMKIEITTEIEGFNSAVESYLSQTVRPAIAAGINAAAEAVKAYLLAELIEDIDNPTAFTRNAFGVLPASSKPGSTGIDMDALVYIKDIQAEYLGFQIDGGVRRAGDYATGKTGPVVPGPHAPVDQYGNLPRNYISDMLKDPHVSWTKMRKRTGYTALVRNVPGKRDPELLAFIMPEIEYNRRFDFYDTAVRSASKHLPDAVQSALGDAVRRVDASDQ